MPMTAVRIVTKAVPYPVRVEVINPYMAVNVIEATKLNL